MKIPFSTVQFCSACFLFIFMFPIGKVYDVLVPLLKQTKSLVILCIKEKSVAM